MNAHVDRDLDLEAFGAFLERGGRKTAKYQPRTKEAMLSTAGRLWRLWSAEQTSDWAVNVQTRMCAARLVAWTDEVLLPAEFVAALKKYLADFRRPKRKPPTRSIDDEAWRRFWAELTRQRMVVGSTSAWVIALQSAIGCRIGDALRVTRTQVLAGFSSSDRKIDLTVKGGKPRVKAIDGALDEWTFFQKSFLAHPEATNIAQLVTPGNASPRSGDAAYKRVRHKLQEIAAAAQVPLRIHTHRLRRTVAVQAVRSGADIMLIKELLDHESIATTAGYLDEQRTDAVTELQKKLRGQR